MSRLYFMSILLEEAYNLDCVNWSKAGGKSTAIRRSTLSRLYRDFVKNYRLTEEMIDDLLENIEHLLQPIRRRGCTHKDKILVALSFLASGNFRRVYNSSISQPTGSRWLHAIVDALNHPTIMKKYIKFPLNVQDRAKLKERFLEKFKIPNVIGCVLGTYVTMTQPTENEHNFICGKKNQWGKRNYARNVQLYADADCNILYVDASYGADVPDSIMFASGEVRQNLEELVNAGETVHLLGGSEYRQWPFLMVPVPDPQPGSPEELYNELHATAYNSAQRAIEMLKSRFRCLLVQYPLRYEPIMVAKIVIACCVLHNICNSAVQPAPTLEPEELQQETRFRTEAQSLLQNSFDESDSDNDDDADDSQSHGMSSRRELINKLWNDAHSIA